MISSRDGLVSSTYSLIDNVLFLSPLFSYSRVEKCLFTITFVCACFRILPSTSTTQRLFGNMVRKDIKISQKMKNKG